MLSDLVIGKVLEFFNVDIDTVMNAQYLETTLSSTANSDAYP